MGLVLRYGVRAMALSFLYINCTINPDEYPELLIKITIDPLSKIHGKCDFALTSAIISDVVDAYCFGMPVVSVLD